MNIEWWGWLVIAFVALNVIRIIRETFTGDNDKEAIKREFLNNQNRKIKP